MISGPRHEQRRRMSVAWQPQLVHPIRKLDRHVHDSNSRHMRLGFAAAPRSSTESRELALELDLLGPPLGRPAPGFGT